MLVQIYLSQNLSRHASRFHPINHLSSHSPFQTAKSAYSQCYQGNCYENMMNLLKLFKRCNKRVLLYTKLRPWSLVADWLWRRSLSFLDQMVTYPLVGAMLSGTRPALSSFTLRFWESKVCYSLIYRHLAKRWRLFSCQYCDKPRCADTRQRWGSAIYESVPVPGRSSKENNHNSSMCNLLWFVSDVGGSLFLRPWRLLPIQFLQRRAKEIPSFSVQATNVSVSTCSRVQSLSKCIFNSNVW